MANAKPQAHTSSYGHASYPVIADYGPAYTVPGAFEIPPKRTEARALFDVSAAPEAPDQVSAGLKRIARYLNLYAAVGVDPKLLHVVAVLHGKATSAALRHEVYSQHFPGNAENPHLALLRALHKAGVVLYVCGQAIRDSGYHDQDIVPDVSLAYSALAVVTNYQDRNFAYFPV
ncbi:MAG TPA: DsrE family protein [Acidiferrobacteraceae bacterium]|nr:DsrE family protein [Acidiferrobacteraceae bacterium]